MASHLSRKDIDDIKPSIDRAVYKLIGTSDSSVLSAAEKCLYSGYDKRKTTEKLSSYLDSKKASKLAEKIFDLVEDYTHKSKKRSHDDSRDRESKRSKTTTVKSESEKESRNGSSESSSKLTPLDIKKMMANAKSEIEERKRNLDVLKAPPPVGPGPGAGAGVGAGTGVPLPSVYGIPVGLLNRGDADKARKIAQLQAQIKNKLSTGILGNSVFSIPAVPDKPTPLILDAEGRTVDKTGKAIQLTHIAPTLKANIRAKKREEFKAQMNDKVNEELSETHFFDSRIGAKPAVRNKRALRFHEPGKFQQLAERLRMKVCMCCIISMCIDVNTCKKLSTVLYSLQRLFQRNFPLKPTL